MSRNKGRFVELLGSAEERAAKWLSCFRVCSTKPLPRNKKQSTLKKELIYDIYNENSLTILNVKTQNTLLRIPFCESVHLNHIDPTYRLKVLIKKKLFRSSSLSRKYSNGVNFTIVTCFFFLYFAVSFYLLQSDDCDYAVPRSCDNLVCTRNNVPFGQSNENGSPFID